MPKLKHSLEFVIEPLPPYDFNLTARNPAGWSLFTPFEIFENGTLWTAGHIEGLLLGIKLSSAGSVETPKIIVKVFSDMEIDQFRQETLKNSIYHKLGAGQDLAEFYEMALKDNILKHTVRHLYGMHDTFPLEVFPEAALAILLQMAPLKRSNEMMASLIHEYGEAAEFDGRSVSTWPTPERIARVSATELSTKCKVGYRAKFLVALSRELIKGGFPSAQELEEMTHSEAKKTLMKLPGIGDYSSDIISPHGGFPIDVWSAEVFGKLLLGEKPENNRQAVERVKAEGIRRWGKWAWMAFFYIVQDLPNLSDKLGVDLRLT